MAGAALARTAGAVKRFFSQATVGEGGSILLDGRPVRTPSGNPLAVPSGTLADAIATAQRTVATRTGALPVLHDLRITASDAGIEIVGSDLEITNRVQAPADVERPGMADLAVLAACEQAEPVHDAEYRVAASL